MLALAIIGSRKEKSAHDYRLCQPERRGNAQRTQTRDLPAESQAVFV